MAYIQIEPLEVADGDPGLWLRTMAIPRPYKHWTLENLRIMGEKKDILIYVKI